MSRLMTALLLYKSGFEVGKYISIETKIAKTKLNYYEALQNIDIDEGWHEGDNDVTPFIKYLLGVILACYRDFENRLELVEEKKPALQMVRNAVKRNKKSRKAQIVEYLPALRRAAVEKALKILVDEGQKPPGRGGGRSVFYTEK